MWLWKIFKREKFRTGDYLVCTTSSVSNIIELGELIILTKNNFPKWAKGQIVIKNMGLDYHIFRQAIKEEKIKYHLVREEYEKCHLIQTNER